MPVWRVRRSRLWRGLAALPFFGVPVALLSAIVGGNTDSLLFIAHGLAFGVAAQYFAWHKNPDPTIEPTTATVQNEHLVVGAASWPVAELRSGIILRSKRGPIVRLSRGRTRFPIDLGVRTEEEGKRLLSQLGLGGHQSVATFRGLSRAQLVQPWKAALATVSCMALGVFSAYQLMFFLSSIVVFFATVLLFVSPLIVLMAAPTKIDVGADGVRLRWLGRDSFTPMADIKRVYVEEVAVHNQGQMRLTLERHDDEPVVVPLGNAQTDFGQAEAVAARIRWAMEGHGAGEDATPQLRRDERPLSEWVERLRGLERHATHRHANVSRDALWSTLEDASAAPLDRAAAAVALREQLGPDERRRIATAARATAAPRLRIALERSLDDDEPALLEALAELEATQASASPFTLKG